MCTGAGTDVMGMTTTATLSADGQHYLLNGTKMWITNGTVDGTDTGDVFLVYAKTGTGRAVGDITSFLVEKGMPGFSLGSKVTDKCGMRASNTAELVFQDVKVKGREGKLIVKCEDCCDVSGDVLICGDDVLCLFLKLGVCNEGACECCGGYGGRGGVVHDAKLGDRESCDWGHGSGWCQAQVYNC